MWLGHEKKEKEPYVHKEYPKWITRHDGLPTLVHSIEEEKHNIQKPKVKRNERTATSPVSA